MKIHSRFLVWSIIGLTWMIGCSSHKAEDSKTSKAPALVFDEDPKYVGVEECKQCHWREVDSWKHTLHSKFMQPASENTVIGDFLRNNTLEIKVSRKSPKLSGQTATTTMYRKDKKFFVQTVGPDWESHDYEVVNVIGINRRQNYVARFPNGALHVLPVEWDVDKRAWQDYYGLRNYYPGSGRYWSDTARTWQFNCAGCHVTGLSINYNPESDQYKSEWVDLGISCEACHGPGANHIKAAKVYFENENDTIINPAKLPWRLRSMVCGQCHNWGMSTEEIAAGKDGIPDRYAFAYGFKPGRSLYLFYIENPEEEKKHHQQYNEWNESQHAQAGIMCTNCHGVHEEGAHKSPRKSQTRSAGDLLCTKCHKTQNQRAAHRIHTFGSCVACHMPQTKGHEHSHTFKFISPEESIRAGGVKRQPNSCSGCHYHKKTPLKNLIEFLDAAKKSDMPKPFEVHGR